MNMEFRCDESEENQAHAEEHKLNDNNTCNINIFYARDLRIEERGE